jgi:hypothetical protein
MSEWRTKFGYFNTIEVVALNAAIRQPGLLIVRISDNAWSATDQGRPNTERGF